MIFTIKLELSQVIAVICLLILFGIGYNHFEEWAERRGYTEGYLSLVVALGVLGTLIALAILSWQSALLALICFIASGTPMIIGSIIRYLKLREAAIERMKNERQAARMAKPGEGSSGSSS